jgi:hypothetical protein
MTPITQEVRSAAAGRRLAPAEFGSLFASFTVSAFRLETLPEYRVEDEAAKLDLFLSGAPRPPDGNEEWCALVADAVASGKRMARVHVVPRRLTPYLRFEIEWGYLYSAAAGEEILRLQEDSPAGFFGALPVHDFWLFDDRVCVRMHYDPAGRFLFGELIDDPAALDAYRQTRDLAMAGAVPLRRFLAEERNS